TTERAAAGLPPPEGPGPRGPGEPRTRPSGKGRAPIAPPRWGEARLVRARALAVLVGCAGWLSWGGRWGRLRSIRGPPFPGFRNNQARATRTRSMPAWATLRPRWSRAMAPAARQAAAYKRRAAWD